MNTERPQSSAMVDLKDPIQVHLITETALLDSKQYHILSQEEVDDLKKQSQFLLQRIESVRRNLTIQAKYRDAAISMAKLYSPSKADAKRRSLLGNRQSGQSIRDAEEERIACESKCEELASELFNLEKRLMEPHRLLLEHTAGILQLTHKASKRKQANGGQVANGIPGSPESLYTYPHSRSSMDPGSDETFMADGIYDFEPPKNAFDIPVKSPVREQNQQLRDEAERARDENKQLHGQSDSLMNTISETEQKLQDLNGALRQTIIKFNPAANKDYDHPPEPSAAPGMGPEDLIRQHLEYLDSGLLAVRAEQDSYSGGKETGERIEAMNLSLRDLLMTTDYHYTPKPIPPEYDVAAQLTYLEDSLHLVDSQLSQAASSKSQGNEEVETSLRSLWEFIQTGFADRKQSKDDRRRARAEKGLEEDEELSDDEGFDTNEAYSLEEFTSRVRWLFRQTATLKDHKSVLKRQVKQQRELNNKSDAEKDSELQSHKDELGQTRQLVERAEKDAMDAQKMLGDALQDLEEARANAQSSSNAHADLEERDARVQDLETKLKKLQQTLAAAESDTKGAEEMVQKMQSDMEIKEKKFKDNEAEMEKLHVTLAELKTEVTIARAELDSAYGTRAERAADAAAVGNTAEMDKLQGQVGKLKEELSGTVKELEDITKETISSEREKADLESKLDDALSLKASLQAEVQKSRDVVTKLQEDLDAERLKASGAGKPSAGATMLSEQFRAAMREERKKFQEDLKVCLPPPPPPPPPPAHVPAICLVVMQSFCFCWSC